MRVQDKIYAMEIQVLAQQENSTAHMIKFIYKKNYKNI